MPIYTSRRVLPGLWLCAILLLLLALAPAHAARVWGQWQAISAIDSANYDLAINGGKVHIAYQTGGKVYYAWRTLTGSRWTTVLLGDGASPSVAASKTAAYVAYVQGGNIIEASSTVNWASSIVIAGSYASLACDAVGGRHLLVEGNSDGDGYQEIHYCVNTGSGWSAPTLLLDGWYDSGSGNYFGQSSLAALPAGGYVYASRNDAWGGRASWSSSSLRAMATSTYSSGDGAWLAGALTRQSIACGAAGTGFAYTWNGSICYAVEQQGAWGSTVDLGAGAEASIDTTNTVNVAFTNGGTLYHHDGQTAPVQVNGVALTGSGPLIAGYWGEVFVLYRTAANQLALVGTSPRLQPDAQVQISGDAAYLGNDLYNLDGAGQTVTTRTTAGVPATGQLLVENDGSKADTIRVTGTPGGAGWTVVYRDQANTDITAQITGAGWVTPSLAAGASLPLTVQITPNAALGVGAVKTLGLYTNSTGDATARDIVKLAVTKQGYQPDLLIRTSTESAYLGNNLYNLTGLNQTRALTIGGGSTATYVFTVQNDGNANDTIRLTGPASSGGWTVTYYAAGIGNITAQVTGAGWTTAVLPPGGRLGCWVVIKPDSGVTPGTLHALQVTATSSTDATKQDVVVANTTR